jgi:hypothetical protein
MAKLLIEDISANYTDEQTKAEKFQTVEFDFWPGDKKLSLTINTDEDDHYLTFNFDPRKFMEAVTEAITHPTAE